MRRGRSLATLSIAVPGRVEPLRTRSATRPPNAWRELCELKNRPANPSAKPSWRAEALAKSGGEAFAQIAVGEEDLVARSEGRGRIGRRPVFDGDRLRARQLERTVMRFRRERHREVEVEVAERFERGRLVVAEIEPDLGENGVDEGVAIAGRDAGGGGAEASGIEALRQRLGDRRAHGVPPADEKHRFDFAAGQGQPRQCSTQISVKSRRAVSKSSSTLPFRRCLQDFGALVVDAAPAHVDRLDAARRAGADRLAVAVADQEVVLHDLAERRERERMRRPAARRPPRGCRRRAAGRRATARACRARHGRGGRSGFPRRGRRWRPRARARCRARRARTKRRRG